MSDTYFLIVGIILALIGLATLIAAIYRRIACSEKTEATIVRVETDSFIAKGKKVYTYSPVISYTADGRTYKEKAPLSSMRHNKYKAGETITVSINPKNPSDFCFKRKVTSFVFGLIALAFGGLLIYCYFLA